METPVKKRLNKKEKQDIKKAFIAYLSKCCWGFKTGSTYF